MFTQHCVEQWQISTYLGEGRKGDVQYTVMLFRKVSLSTYISYEFSLMQEEIMHNFPTSSLLIKLLIQFLDTLRILVEYPDVSMDWTFPYYFLSNFLLMTQPVALVLHLPNVVSKNNPFFKSAHWLRRYTLITCAS